MTDKEKLEAIKAEIERLSNFANVYYADRIASGYKICCSDITSFIDSLSKEPVSEDLEEAAENALNFEEQAFIYDDPETKEGMTEVYTREQAISMFKAGDKWQKEQMMKTAVGLKINRSTLYDLKPIIHERYQDFKIGDKVKLIIIKDE